MDDNLMHIPNDNTQDYLFCRLQVVVDTQLNKPIKHNSLKVFKVVKPTYKKILS